MQRSMGLPHVLTLVGFSLIIIAVMIYFLKLIRKGV